MVSDDNALIRLQRKLQLLKIAIKSWTKEFRLKSNAKKCQIQQDILCLDKLFDLGLINDDSLNKRALLLNELHEINSVNASELSQKAKIRWSIEGDENSKFFHGIINKKRAQLAIRGILADDYEFLVRLTSDQVEDLESEISNEEVKAAVWDCGVNKSPGPDGYTFEFFRKYWTFIGNDIIQAVKAFFANGCFPRGCNSSFIALIPKIQDAKFVKDFRPISLIGSTYKIISKILANRLCLVLPDLISDVQSAFVANRQILDGPFILNELMSWCKHTKFKGMIFKVDFEKAFDSVKWDYLDETLKSFGFGLKWRNWISGCLNNAKGSVLVNGNPTKEFQFFKGLKQGDPLSPFLFILVMETLHLSFKRIINAGLYRGISINGSLTLSHLFYADDVVFVGEWKDSNIHILLNVLKCFFLASGLKINLQKSKLMGLGVSSNVVNSAANLMGCSILQLPFNYLGVKVGCNMSYIGSWDDVISKVSSRLSKWKIKSLSIGGRLTLLKSVLTSIPLYHMSIFKVPMGVLKKLESIRRNFFNGHDGFARKSSWFNWNKALASKKNGGIGVSSFFAINRALLFKWVWRFFSDGSSLWSTFIKALFGFHGAIGLTVKPNRRSIWSDILQAVNSLKDKGIDFLQFIRKKIGNGVNTSFWADSWIGSIPFKEKFPRLYALEESKSISVADKLGLSSLYLSFRRPPRGGIEQESFNLLCQSVRGLVLSNIEDRWSWSLEGSGLFSVKSSRAYIDDLLLPKADAATRWIRILPIKINVFAWKVCLDALPTRCNMSLRGIDIPSILCPLCNRAVENSDHIFFSCSMVRKVWRRLLTWWELDVSSFHSYNEWISWLSSIRLPKLLKVFLEGSCYVMWWLVWKFRNRLLFSDPTSKPDSLFDDVVQMSFLWMNNRLQAKCPEKDELSLNHVLDFLHVRCTSRHYTRMNKDAFDICHVVYLSGMPAIFCQKMYMCSKAIVGLRKTCPHGIAATGYYNICNLTYSNSSDWRDDPVVGFDEGWKDDSSAPVDDQFNEALRNLLETLMTETVNGGPLKSNPPLSSSLPLAGKKNNKKKSVTIVTTTVVGVIIITFALFMYPNDDDVSEIGHNLDRNECLDDKSDDDVRDGEMNENIVGNGARNPEEDRVVDEANKTKIYDVECDKTCERGIRGVLPSLLLAPPPFVSLVHVDDTGSNWDLIRSFAPIENEDLATERRDEGTSSSNKGVVVEGSEIITSRVDSMGDEEQDSSSVITVELQYTISLNGTFMGSFKNWQKGDFLGSGLVGTVYEGFDE
ncbi:RNA-directed DNA polymerase, eukaryota [Tanacetum coccineum]